jgi:pilus assembly protein CpaE
MNYDAASVLTASPSAEIALERPHERAIAHAKPVPRISIQAFCEDTNTAATLQAATVDRRLARTQFTVHLHGLRAALALYRNTATPNLIIIESLLEGEALMADLEGLAEVCDPGTKIIVIGHVNDVAVYRQLLRRGVSEYLVAPVNVVQVIDCISTLYRNSNSNPLGQMIAFVGVKGGSGSSTVCHNTAWAISELLQSEVAIADLDLPFGTAALDFNQDPGRGILDALFAPERLDAVLLDRLLSRCSERLSLFAAPSTLDRAYDPQPEACGTVLEVLRENIPWIAVDVPHLWTEWARQVVVQCDQIVLTAVPDLANLRNTKNILDQLKLARPNDKPPILVLNQLGVPRRPEISSEDFSDALMLEPYIEIRFDAQLFGAAANNGQMLEEMARNSVPAEQFRLLASRLTNRSEQKTAPQSLLASLLRRLRRSSPEV